MRSKVIRVEKYTGTFSGDKDAAASMRDRELLPALNSGRSVTLDFSNVELATQSFIHALLASLMRASPEKLEMVEFKNCSESVRALIEIVISYTQDDL